MDDCFEKIKIFFLNEGIFLCHTDQKDNNILEVRIKHYLGKPATEDQIKKLEKKKTKALFLPIINYYPYGMDVFYSPKKEKGTGKKIKIN
jgi:hypothetical protein